MGASEASVLRPWVDHAPWAHIAVLDDSLTAIIDGKRRRWSVARWPDVAAARISDGQLLVAANLGSKLRAQMSRRGQSFADHSALHLTGEGVLLHLEHVGSDDRRPDKPQRAIRSLPPGGVRAALLMLAEPDATWSVRRLHERSQLSVGHAQNILTILDQADLLEVAGSGPRTTRRVRDRTEMLDWLAAQPAARAKPLQWATHIYGRNGREVLASAARGLEQAHCDYAVTGMAAATLAGLGATDATRVHIWIDPNRDMASVAEHAGLKRMPRGGNVVLWSDADGSGRAGATVTEDVLVARPGRVYLDLLSLPRGDDVANLYRRVMLGY